MLEEEVSKRLEYELQEDQEDEVYVQQEAELQMGQEAEVLQAHHVLQVHQEEEVAKVQKHKEAVMLQKIETNQNINQWLHVLLVKLHLSTLHGFLKLLNRKENLLHILQELLQLLNLRES